MSKQEQEAFHIQRVNNILTTNMYDRSLLLEDCEWLFGQEVRIVTFNTGLSPDKPTGDWFAIVIPKLTTLRSLAQHNINDTILLKGSASSTIHYMAACEDAIANLHINIAEKIGKVLHIDSDGLYEINESEIPTPIKSDTVNTQDYIKPETSSTGSSSTQTEPVPNTQDLFAPTVSQKPPFQDLFAPIVSQKPSFQDLFGSGSTTNPRGVPNPFHSTPTSEPLIPSGPQIKTQTSPFNQDVYSTWPPSNLFGVAPANPEFTPGTSVMSNTDSGSTTLPWSNTPPSVSDNTEAHRLSPSRMPLIDQGPREQQMMRAEIKSAMSGFLMCLTEHIEGMS